MNLFDFSTLQLQMGQLQNVAHVYFLCVCHDGTIRPDPLP